MLSSIVRASVVVAALAATHPAGAQTHEHGDAAAPGWAWSGDASVFLTANVQIRKFRDFNQLESQNWLMAAASRRAAGGTLTLHGMFSLEPFTLRELGSAQVFQTGETLDAAPLIDYQHPHDLVMGLSGALVRPLGRAALTIRGGLVDAPALGPTPFMHRASASLQPTAPLTHHHLDATHIASSVLTAGIAAGAWSVEASAFHGREPDEDRLDLDLGAPDSWAARVAWRARGLVAQASVGRLREPEAAEPGNVTRLTASLEASGTLFRHPIASTLAWGRNDNPFAAEHGLLAEASVGLGRTGIAYSRAELADKHILEAGGLHPPGSGHPHILSRVGALTSGYRQDVWRTAAGRTAAVLALGGDITGYVVPPELRDSYGHPVSIHVFGHWRLERR